MSSRQPEPERLLTPAEVAAMFRVDPKTVTRWAKAGKLTSIRTLGGHRRYRAAEVEALLAGLPAPRDGDDDAEEPSSPGPVPTASPGPVPASPVTRPTMG